MIFIKIAILLWIAYFAVRKHYFSTLSQKEKFLLEIGLDPRPIMSFLVFMLLDVSLVISFMGMICFFIFA